MSYMENRGKIYLNNNRYITTSVGIYADKVGSGKSVTILSRIMKQPILKPSSEILLNIFGKIILRNSYNSIYNIKCNIIVVSHSIFIQWLSYIKNYTNLKVYCIKIKNDIYNLKKKKYRRYSRGDYISIF